MTLYFVKLSHFCFKNQHTATGSQIDQWSDLQELPYQLGIATGQPVLVLVGGASKMEPEALDRLQQFFTEVLAPLMQRLNGVVIDGGTDCGVMQLMGQAREQIGATFPLIGVCAIGTVILPDGTPPISPDAAELEPHHSHFVLVPGDTWGAESPWLAKLATVIAAGFPSCTMVSNGGEITWQDVGCSVEERRTTFVLDGSGRTADAIAAALKGEDSDPRSHPLIASGYLQRLALGDELETLQQVLQTCLAGIKP
ncbi:MAG: hypothetical protein R6U67_10475 [Sodalinema sp.]|uniref:hypothetical protein n=1 Tax=Sodalinema sp. TaxID=3080550 RepID=UPI00396F2CA8